MATHPSRPHLRDLKNNLPNYENIEITSSRMPFHIFPASSTPEGDVSFLRDLQWLCLPLSWMMGIQSSISTIKPLASEKMHQESSFSIPRTREV